LWRATKLWRISAPASISSTSTSQLFGPVVEPAVVVAQHRKQHRQREVGVVHAALLAALAVHRVHRLPALICATTVRWPGMIQKNTLALMAVAIIAPTSRKAARPANSWQASHEPTTPARTPAPHDGVAVLALAEDAADGVVQQPERHEESQRHDDGVAGAQSNTILSTRKVLALKRYEHREQRKAGEPGAVALPVEPVQVLGQAAAATHVLPGGRTRRRARPTAHRSRPCFFRSSSSGGVRLLSEKTK
jgi:hypothetical protein